MIILFYQFIIIKKDIYKNYKLNTTNLKLCIIYILVLLSTYILCINVSRSDN